MTNEVRRPAANNWSEINTAKCFVLFITAVLQACDVLTTNALIGVPGAVEANLIMAAEIDSLGTFWWVPKVLVLPTVFYVLGRYRKLWPAIFVVVLYSLIVANNIFVIAMTRGF